MKIDKLSGLSERLKRNIKWNCIIIGEKSRQVLETEELESCQQNDYQFVG